MLTPNATIVLPFLGFDAATYDTADVVILPIPYEATTTYRKGCKHGPYAILEASHQVEYYDEELDRETGCEVLIYTHDPVADTREGRSISAAQMLQVTQETVSKLIGDRKFVFALGGEHSITAPIVEAYRQAYANEPFTVVQIDAHPNLRHEYEGSIYNHACVMRRIVDMGLATVQIGIRAISKEEADFIKDKQLKVFRAREIANNPNWIEQAIQAIPTDKVFLTIDLDSIDPALIPGVGTPEPGGLNWYELSTFLRSLCENYNVIGCDVMELAPVVDSVVSQFTAAKLVYKIIGYQALAKGWFKT